jgi:hypothetical protein
MEFADLKEKILKEIELDQPQFATDTGDSLSVGHLELGATQKLVFSISSYRGRKYMDIRTWFQDQAGDWKPTKKGIHFSFDKFEDFEKMLKIYAQIYALDS